MTRIEFTKKIVKFIQEMIDAGESPALDDCKRSDYEQQRLYSVGRIKNDDGTWSILNPSAILTMVDGVNVKSKHQIGVACDIYFIDDKGKIDFSEGRYAKWHIVWQEKYGGRPVIVFKTGEHDWPHFE